MDKYNILKMMDTDKINKIPTQDRTYHKSQTKAISCIATGKQQTLKTGMFK